MDSITLLQSLSDAFGVSGFEDEVRDTVQGLIKPYIDQSKVDALGNVIATRKGKSRFKLMLDAHMDEIGLMISFVDQNGYLRFTAIGGWDERILPSHAVTILTRAGKKISGVIGTAPPHILKKEEREKPIKLEDMFIDVGATTEDQVKELGIRVGDPATIHYSLQTLSDNYVLGKAMDDRAGCAVMIKTLESLKDQELDLTLVCNFAVGEETGLRGARTAAYQIEPDLALALEGTIGADMPGIKLEQRPVTLGKGPAITVADRTIIVNRKLVEALEKVAEENRIPYQHKMPLFGGTDAGAIHLSRAGVMAGVVSVPCRYIHSPHSTMRLDDFENTVRLATEFTRNCRRLLG